MTSSAQGETPPIDHLTGLPSELIQNIASYLFPTHGVDYAKGEHDLENLAGTCRTLRHEVNNWAQHFLLQHQTITKYKSPKGTTVKRVVRPKNLRSHQPVHTPTFAVNHLRRKGRLSQGLLSWSENKCVFCGKLTCRSAIMMNSLRCCKNCDKAQWPQKITKTDALKEYDLKDHHLTPHRHHTGAIVENMFRDLGIPRLRCGMYVCQGTLTTMFMREDVANWRSWCMAI